MWQQESPSIGKAVQTGTYSTLLDDVVRPRWFTRSRNKNVKQLRAEEMKHLNCTFQKCQKIHIVFGG